MFPVPPDEDGRSSSPEELVDGVARTEDFSLFRRRRGRRVPSESNKKTSLVTTLRTVHGQ